MKKGKGANSTSNPFDRVRKSGTKVAKFHVGSNVLLPLERLPTDVLGNAGFPAGKLKGIYVIGKVTGIDDKSRIISFPDNKSLGTQKVANCKLMEIDLDEDEDEDDHCDITISNVDANTDREESEHSEDDQVQLPLEDMDIDEQKEDKKICALEERCFNLHTAPKLPTNASPNFHESTASTSRGDQITIEETRKGTGVTTRDPKVSEWWKTDICDIKHGEIRYRGYEIQDLIGRVSFAQMIWLMLRGELPTKPQADLLDMALMSAVDHGPQAPSIAIARMAATCGVGLNNAMASAMNVLGDIHGGAGEQAVELYRDISASMETGVSLEDAVTKGISDFTKTRGKFLPGFGHRFHPIDPRSPRLMEVVEQATRDGVVSGQYARIAIEIEAHMERRKGKKIPMNIDGATAVIYAELGLPAPLARGLFCLSRSVGILAHAWEETEQKGRNKGPMPKEYLWSYTGKKKRALPEE